MVKLNTAEEYIAYFIKHPEPWNLSLPMEERTKVFAYADEHKIDSKEFSFLYSWCLQFGFGTEKDLKKSVEWNENNKFKEVDRKNSFIDFDNAFDAFYFSITENDENEDAETHSEIINFEEDLYEYLEKAKAGDPYAMYQLGSYYFYKNLDPEKGFELLSKSAEAGNQAAYKILAECYGTGYGTKVDYDERLKWILKSALVGDVDSMISLGVDLIYGNNCEKNITEGLKWIEKAYDYDNKMAPLAAIICYIDEDVKTTFTTKVYNKYKELADNGDEDAIKLMLTAIMEKPSKENLIESYKYIKLVDVSKYKLTIASWALIILQTEDNFDFEEDAKNMLIQLADEDCLYACKELGFSYANEINRFEKDHKKAAKYLKIAAQSGDKACDIELGYLYSLGEFGNDYVLEAIKILYNHLDSSLALDGLINCYALNEFNKNYEVCLKCLQLLEKLDDEKYYDNVCKVGYAFSRIDIIVDKLNDKDLKNYPHIGLAYCSALLAKDDSNSKQKVYKIVNKIIRDTKYPPAYRYKAAFLDGESRHTGVFDKQVVTNYKKAASCLEGYNLYIADYYAYFLNVNLAVKYYIDGACNGDKGWAKTFMNFVIDNTETDDFSIFENVFKVLESNDAKKPDMLLQSYKFREVAGYKCDQAAINYVFNNAPKSTYLSNLLGVAYYEGVYFKKNEGLANYNFSIAKKDNIQAKINYSIININNGNLTEAGDVLASINDTYANSNLFLAKYYFATKLKDDYIKNSLLKGFNSQFIRKIGGFKDGYIEKETYDKLALLVLDDLKPITDRYTYTYYLALAYRYGFGYKKDIDKFFELLEKASENLWEAKVLLGLNLMYSTTDTYNLDPMDSSGAFFDFGYIELLDENRNEEEFSKGVDLVLQAYHMNPKGLDKLCLKLKKLNVIYEDKED